MKNRFQNLKEKLKLPKTWIAAATVAVILIAGVVFALWLRRPMAKYNADRDDAAQVYFSHLALAADSNRILFETGTLPEDYADDSDALRSTSYAYATVLEVLSDDSHEDETTENVHVGSQTLLIEITTGEYKGRQLEITNYMSKLFDKHAKKGTSLLVYLLATRKTAADTEPALSVSVMNYNRQWLLFGLVAVFLLVTVLVGGKVGFRSILGLGLTLAAVVFLLVPALLKGFYAIPLTLILCVLMTIVCFLLLDGLSRKTVSAILGTVAGFTVACLFAILASRLAHLDGLEYNVAETDTLIQAKYQGTLINIRGLFVSGIIISALGAVMDVAMSISSSINELKTVNSSMGFSALFKSGMRIGRDAVGTMTNTLILAFTGGALVNLLLIKYYNWDWKAILSGDYITHEVITGISGSIGLILAVPLTALIAAALCGRMQPDPERLQPVAHKPADKKRKKTR
ncbi:MAG: YibE/F family protein [Clostridia bacterium]|nr:YibE/F family protein [Clostridia bacterium]